MKLKLDISAVPFENSEIVRFYDSKTIFFEPTNTLPETVSFKIWGADIDERFNWAAYLDLDNFPNLKKVLEARERTLTIKGFSEITFERVVGGRIEISPYDKGSFVRLKNGERQILKREWNLNKVDDDCYKYWLDTNIYFPYGACDLKLYTKGKVWFEFNPADCVDYLEYIGDPKRNETFWGYLSDTEFCTNSISYEEADPEK